MVGDPDSAEDAGAERAARGNDGWRAESRAAWPTPDPAQQLHE